MNCDLSEGNLDDDAFTSDRAAEILDMIHNQDEISAKKQAMINISNKNSPNNVTEPGAQRIEPTRNDRDETETSGLRDFDEPKSPMPLIEATAVHDRYGEKLIEDMLAKAREEGREEAAKGPVLEGEIIEEVANKRQKYWTIAVIAAFALFGVTGTSLSVAIKRPTTGQQLRAPPTTSPSHQPVTTMVNNLLEFLETVPYVPAPLSYSAAVSAEDKALAWLADEDPLVPSLMQNGNFERLKQRFALLSFAFSNPSYPFETIENQEDECLWPYIVCSNETRSVIGIDSQRNRLLGSVPESLGLLTDIRKLNLYGSKLQGTLPMSISQLTLLEEFEVGVGDLSGPFPWDSFRNMSDLAVLSIEDNLFSGELPRSLDLPKIKSAHLAFNGFTGTLPSELSSWTSLEVFYVDSTLLSGLIPSEYGAWTNIKRFYAYKTNLSGSLPASLGDWHQIESFVVSSSGLTGEIPSTYTSWRNLTHGYFDGTSLKGSMPLCDLNKVFDILTADCFNVSCPCCTGCCPTAVGSIPQFEQCQLQLNL